MLIPLDDIQAAAERIKPVVPTTPLVKSHYYSEKLKTNIYFKLELLNPTHSFKTRGATNAILSLTEEQRQNGVITASGGNHGLGVAYVAYQLGIPAYIYLPTTTPPSKVEDLEAFGAKITLIGDAFDDANQEALAHSKRENIAYIHPFDDVNVIAGQATIGLEITQQLDNITAVLGSIGGGGMMAGVTSSIKALSPQTKIYGVETIGADSMTQSYKNGEITTLPAITSIANTLGAKSPGKRHFEIMKAYAEDLVTVTDAQSVQSLWEILNKEKLLVEPAMSCVISALEHGKITYQADDNIVVIVCGGNIKVADAIRWREQFNLS